MEFDQKLAMALKYLERDKDDKLDEAQVICDELHAERPEYVPVLRCMAIVAERKGELARCRELLIRIVNLAPDHPGYRQALGIIMQKTGAFEAAFAHFRRAMELGVPEKDGLLNLMRAYFDKGDYETAFAYMRRSPKLFDKTCRLENLMALQIVEAGEYCAERGILYRQVDPKREVHLDLGEGGPVNYVVNEAFLTCLDDVRVIPDNCTVIAEGKYLVYRGFDTNSRAAVVLLDAFHYETSDHRVLADIPFREQVVEEEMILFGGGPNFSHCVCDWFSKLYVLRKFPQLEHLPLYVARSVLPKIFELFEIFGVPRERIVLYDDTAVLVCKRAWLPSLTHAFQFVSPYYLRWFREVVFSQATVQPRKRRLFLARQNAAHRRLTNEGEAVALLQRYGFEVVFPETLSIREQIDLFASTEMMVIPIGGASASSLFLQEGAAVVELSNPTVFTYQYELTSAHQGVHFHRITGELEANNTGRLDIDRDYSIPVPELAALLERYFPGEG